MWSGQPGAPVQGMYSAPPPAAPMTSSAQTGQKHDIFVGNLAFNTTEEQLHQAFSELGRVINVRLVTDVDTGKPRGFAFVEFDDPQAALSAIRNMNDYELNGRRLRVNFSNSSHLEVLANKLGMDLSQQTQGRTTTNSNNNATPTAATPAAQGANAVAEALKGMSKGEMYDVLAKLKEIADRDADEARRIISGHPQLPEALLFLMSKLDMVQTPIVEATMTSAAPPSLPTAATPALTPLAAAPRPADPRARPADPRAISSDPRSRVVDPRTQQQQPPPPRSDPRQQQQQQQQPPVALPPAAPQQQQQQPPPPPPPMYNNYGQQQQQLQQQHSHHNAHGSLDPGLVQQVMSLTPQQIQQLPLDKQQSILQLRQQITGQPM